MARPRIPWLALLAVAVAGALVALGVSLRADRPAAQGPAAHVAPEGGEASPAPRRPSAPADTLDDRAPGTLAGVVVDAFSGSAVPGLDVVFTAADGAAEITVTSDGGGRFDALVPPGRYQVRAGGPDRFGALRRPVEVAPGQHHGDLELAVARVAHVRGRVISDDGAPLAGAEVRFRALLPRGASVASDPDGAGVAALGAATSGADGRYELVVLPGEVELHADLHGRSGRLELRRVAPGARVDAPDLVIAAGIAVTGHVFTPAGAPAAGAAVHMQGERSGRRLAVTSDDGTFALANLADDTWLVEARAPGFAPSAVARLGRRRGAVSPAEPLTLRLGPPRSITGRVVGPDGAAMAGARVRALRLSAADPVTAITDADGRFALVDLDAGPFALVANKDGLAAARAANVPAPTVDLELRLGALGAIAGVVRGPGGAPLPAFTVEIVDGRLATGVRASLERRERFASADGAFHLGGLEAGRYELVVSAPGAAAARRTVDVPEAGLADASLSLVAGASVAGLVVDSQTGAPIGGVRITVLSLGDQAAVTDADGRFVLGGVAPGRRSLSFDHPGYVIKSVGGINLDGDRRTEIAEVRMTPLARDGASAAGSGARAGREVEYAGIGAVLNTDGQGVVIQGLLPGGPGEGAGLRVGDRLLAVDGVPCQGRPLSEVIEDIRGASGTSVRITVQRQGQDLVFIVARGNVRFGG
jgi:protocatechuate 3,4-dioxygenase beta subunit